MADNSLYNLYIYDAKCIRKHQRLDFDSSGQKTKPTFELWKIVIRLREEKWGNDNQMFYNYLHDEIGIVPALGMEQQGFQDLKKEQDKKYKTTLKGNLIGNAIAELKRGHTKTYWPYLLAWLWHDHPDDIRNFYTKIGLKHNEFPTPSDLEQVKKTENNHQLENKSASISLSKDTYIDPFQTRIEKLSIDFFERKHVFKEIDKFLQENDSGFITVRGDGGTGKSAILANAVKKYSKSDEFNCVYYFVSHGTDHDNTINFIECIYEQLNRIYDLSSLKADYERLPTAWHSLSGTFLKKLIQTVALQTKQPLLIAVDALDEISDNDVTKQISKRNFLFIPEQELPENIFFLISSRNKKKQVYAGKQLNLSLEKKETHQQEDIHDYIKEKSARGEVKHWIKKNKLDANSFTEILYKKSECRFLYLFHVFQNITGFENIDALPQGIEEFYERQYDRFFSDEKNKEIKKIILAGILHFKPDISLYHLSALCGRKQIKVGDMIKNWIAIRLIDEIIVHDVPYLKFSHLLFYEFINKHIIELQKIENSPDSYKKLAKRTAKDITINNEAKSIVYKNHHQKKMQIETIKLIPESFFKSGNMLKLSTYLTNWTFCKEYVNLIDRGEWKIIDYLAQMYTQMSDQNYPQEQLDKILTDFIKNIVDIENETNTIISNKEITSIFTNEDSRLGDTDKHCSGNRGRKFIKRYDHLIDNIIWQHASDDG